jgi:diguanylate cyclase (GGDEF)-like protein
VAVIDRRALIAVAGAVLGVTGAVSAVVWTPAAAFVAAIGALVAAAVAIASPAPAETESADIEEPVEVEAANATAPTPIPVGGAVSGAETPVPVASNGSSGAKLLIDPETGLFSEDYFNVAIEARIAAARRHLRPVGVVVMEVVEGMRIGKVHNAEPTQVAHAIQETLREADTSCRRSDGRFALLLEDTPENGAIWTVERIRRVLAEHDPSLTLWAGVACYPAHGFDSTTLVALAGTALDTAREWRQDRIEVAVGE